jgi:uncharacterized protein YcbX
VATVSWISIAPVKGLALVHPREVLLEAHGVTENRRFYIVDDDGRRYGLLRDGRLWQVEVDYEVEPERLSLRFPDGTVVAGDVSLDGEVTTDFYGREVEGQVVVGSWSEALSQHVGRAVHLIKAVRPGAAVDRGRGGVSLVSDASLEELARRADTEAVDARRFRMLLGVAGCEPHEEDGWLGGEVRIGDARARLLGTVGRCAITTRNPATGERDLDTLGVIKSYRGPNPRTKEFDFGVFGEVVRPGRVRIGDPVEPIRS